MFVLNYTSIERFSVDARTTEINILRDGFENEAKFLVNIINMNKPNVSLKDVYIEMLEVITKDIKTIKHNNNILNTKTSYMNNKTTSDWHDYYSKLIFIHTAFIIMFITIVFQWLYISFPSMDFMFILFALIAILIVIFNYMYWTKMNNI